MAFNNNCDCGMNIFNMDINLLNNFNNCPMNPMNRNICKQNVDQFAEFNGINSIQNKPKIFDNFGGQLIK